MIQNLREKLEAHIKNIKAMSSKEIEHLKNKQTEMKNTLEETNRIITEGEEWISKLEDSGGNHCCKTE